MVGSKNRCAVAFATTVLWVVGAAQLRAQPASERGASSGDEPGSSPPVAASSSAPGSPKPGAEQQPSEGAAVGKPELAEAKRLFRQGNELRRAGDYQRALELYLRSRALVPSVPNMWNAAVCLDQLGRLDEALELYEQLLTEYSDRLSPQDRGTIRDAVRQLRGRVGSLDVLANVAGSLVIDGRMRGTLPLGGPVRVLEGRRVVQVMKEGYVTFETIVDVVAGQTGEVVARLKPLVGGGRLRVDDAALTGAEVIVDGAVLGTVPWEGTLAPGEHHLVVRKGDLGSAPTRVMVVKRQTVRAHVQMAPLGPEMRVTVKPATAELSIDQVSVGRGRWQGRLPRGEHRVDAREEGYFAQTRSIAVTADAAPDTALVLKVDEKHPRWGLGDVGHLWVEAFAGLGIAPSLRSGAEADCQSGRCSQDPAALGLAVGARAGYEFPVGVSVVITGGYATMTKSVARHVDESFYEASTQSVVPTSYDLEDELHLAGPFAGGGIGYRVPFGDVLELKGNLLIGAFFSFTRDEIAGTASAAGRTVPVHVERSGTTVEAANLFVMPELHLGLRFDKVGVAVGLATMLLALEGPTHETGDVRVVGDGCTGSPTAIDCAPGEAFAEGEKAYDTLVLWLPSISAGYAF